MIATTGPIAPSALIDPKFIFEKVRLGPGMRVADLGCGRTGHFIFQASKQVGERGIVYAVDIVKNILESIESRVRSEGFHNIQTIWTDIERLGKMPIPPATLDVSFLINVLYLMKDQQTAFMEAARVTNKDGRVVVVEWSKKLGPLGPDQSMLLAPETIIGYALKAGLVVEQQFTVGDCHYCLIFKKK